MAFHRRVSHAIGQLRAGIALAAFASLPLALLPGSSALAASLTYVDQSGAVSASGSTPSLGSSSQSFPVTGLDDVNLIAQVANGAWSLGCNPHDPGDPLCGEMQKAVSQSMGGVLPAGRYELYYHVFAFQPGPGSCELGCGSASGTMRFAIVPESGTRLLLMTGMLGLAYWQWRHGRVAHGTGL
jgi:hypothetical protein